MRRDELTFGVHGYRAEAKRLQKVISGQRATLEDVTAQREWEDLPSRWEAGHAPCPASRGPHRLCISVDASAPLLLHVSSLLMTVGTPESHASLFVMSETRGGVPL